LRECLRSLMVERPSEIVVVDNASTDGSRGMVEREFPSVRLCPNPTNEGFGVAANQAVEACSAEYVLLLNADTVVQPGTLAALTNDLDRHPTAGLVGPRLVGPDSKVQPSCFPFPGPFYSLLQLSNLHAIIRSLPLLGCCYLPAWKHNSHRSVPWIQGAAMALRRKAFRAVGGFDPSFFMYFEDTDLCERLRKAGWEIHFDPSTSVIHVGGASTRKLRVQMMIRFYDSLILLYRRHCSRAKLQQLLVVLQVAMLARLLRDRLRVRTAPAAATRRRVADNISIWCSVLAHVRATRVSLSR
jgi:GT2 family glycosyltransferase